MLSTRLKLAVCVGLRKELGLRQQQWGILHSCQQWNNLLAASAYFMFSRLPPPASICVAVAPAAAAPLTAEEVEQQRELHAKMEAQSKGEWVGRCS